jgi:hypothetical protein
MQMLLSFVIWLLIGGATAYFAQQRGRDPFIWFMIGMFLGLLGLLLVFLLPSLEEPDQEAEGHEEHLVESQVPAKTHDYLIKDWFYLDALRQQQGPMRFEILKKIWEQGSISENSYVWCEGMKQWEKIENLPDLKNAFQ